MALPEFESIIAALKTKGVEFDPGLTADELRQAEQRYDFTFPPDLREFLAIALPVSNDFPNWRKSTYKGTKGNYPIEPTMDWPYRGMCFDIENNGFWIRDWGQRPDDLHEAFAIARKMVKAAPPLIPVFSHRYLPAEPLAAGNPVISVYQTDIIYYGRDLHTYLMHEFKLSAMDHATATEGSRRIRFWSDIIDGVGTEQTSNRFMP